MASAAQSCPWHPPTCPTGFVHFRTLPEVYLSNRVVWRARMGWRGGRLFPAIQRIADGLLAGTFRAAGSVIGDGSLVWAPAHNWSAARLVGGSESASEWQDLLRGREPSAWQAVAMGRPLLFVGAGGEFPCYPILEARDLALACEAEAPPPEPPASVLERIREIEFPTSGDRKQVPWDPNVCGGWFLMRVRVWPPDEPFPSEEVDLTAAREYFDRVPRDIFRKIREDKTPPEWRKPGPRVARK